MAPKSLLPLLFLIFIQSFLFGQNQPLVDSLNQIVSAPNSTLSDTIQLAKAINLFGESLAKNNQYDLAKEKFLSTISLFPENAMIEELGYTYNNLGTLMSRNSDPGAAIPFIHHASRIFSNFLGPSHLYIGVIQKNLAMQYGRINNYEVKYKLLVESDSILAFHLPPENPRRLEALRELGFTYQKLGEANKAQHSFEKLVHLSESINPINHDQRLRAYDAMAAFKFQNPKIFQPTEILETYSDYISKLESVLGPGHKNLRDLYNNYALQLSFGGGQEEKAYDIIRMAMESNYGLQKPKLSDIPNPNVLDLRLMQNKGSLTHQLYQKNRDHQYLLESYSTFLSSDSLAELIKLEVLNQSSRLKLKGEYASFYNLFNATCISLYEETADKKYLSRLFNNIEKMKSWELVERYKTAQSKEIEKDSFFHKIHDLGSQIKRMSLFDESEERSIQNQLELEGLIQKHPSYFKLLYGFETASLEKVEQYCRSQNQQWLHFFHVTPNQIGILGITPDSTFIFTDSIFLDSIKTDIEKLRTQIQSKKWAFAETSYRIYKSLIQPIEHILKGPELIITAHSSLRLVPFEVLLTEDGLGANIEKIRKHYLLNEYDIRYQPSATKGLLTYQENQIINSAEFFAPKYADESLALKWNEAEVRGGQDLISGNIHLEDITKESFIRSLQESKLIHFAGHTITNQLGFDSIYLLLGSDTLFLQDILRTESNAPLIVLSACQSALGKATTEDLMGPSYGFGLAGTPNVISTLWNVSDRESSTLYKYYYKELSNGRNTSRALTEAKKTYLQNAPLPGQHPYYWANPIYIGQPLMYQSNDWNWILAPLALVLGIVGLLILNKLKQRSQ